MKRLVHSLLVLSFILLAAILLLLGGRTLLPNDEVDTSTSLTAAECEEVGSVINSPEGVCPAGTENLGPVTGLRCPCVCCG